MPKALSEFGTNDEFREFALSLLVGLPFFVIFELLIGETDFDQVMNKNGIVLRWITYFVLVLIILLFGVLHSAPQFIYFQF